MLLEDKLKYRYFLQEQSQSTMLRLLYLIVILEASKPRESMFLNASTFLSVLLLYYVENSYVYMIILDVSHTEY